MAEQTDIARIRALTDGDDTYTDEQLAAMLDGGMTVREIAHDIWETKAAKYAGLVNTSESGSSRNLGDLYKNALAMAARFEPLETISQQQRTKGTRTAVRS